MIISHWLYPVQVLGPGNRLALWVQGCRRKCQGCISPELQDYSGTNYDVNTLSIIINTLMQTHNLDGITISGGEPFDQCDDLVELCSQLSTNDILVYTGYSDDELRCIYPADLTLTKIGVIITSPYIEELNDNLPLRGSSNQEIIFLKNSLKNSYTSYLESSHREQQLFVEDNAIYFAGIPLKGHANIIRDEINKVIKGERDEY